MISEYISWNIPGLDGFGLFYIIFLILTIGFTIYLLKISKEHDEKEQVKVVFIIGIVFLLLETFRQLYSNDLSFKTPYTWDLFPFQLCSTPMYFCLLVPILSKKHRNYVYSFLAFYGFLGGLAVYIVPSSVVVEDAIISARSLIWHGLQICLGCYLIKTQNFGYNYKELLPGTIWFLIVTLLAIFMNDVYEACREPFNLTYSFNMFQLSPYYNSDVPLLREIWDATNWYFGVFCYVVGLYLATSIMWGSTYLYNKCVLPRLNKEVA